MTNKEAVWRIRDHMIVHHLSEPRAILITEALEMAIKALEKEDQEEISKIGKVRILTEDEIKDVSAKDDVFINVHKELETYCRLVVEEQDRFIFETISPFLHSISNTIIPKRVLERALTTFCEEHNEEWKILMNEHGNCFVEEEEEDEEE